MTGNMDRLAGKSHSRISTLQHIDSLNGASKAKITRYMDTHALTGRE